jgi:hypothetical protein
MGERYDGPLSRKLFDDLDEMPEAQSSSDLVTVSLAMTLDDFDPGAVYVPDPAVHRK